MARSKKSLASKQLTIGQHIQHLLPRTGLNKKVPRWPPDVFAVCVSLLAKSGSYCAVLEKWPPVKDWAKNTIKTGKRWRATWQSRVPNEVVQLWNVLILAWDIPASNLKKNQSLFRAAMELAAIADEACSGVGIPGLIEDDRFQLQADVLLEPLAAGSTLCMEVDRSRVRVLPKMRTPQSGLTLRSLSNHLSLCNGNEVCPSWIQTYIYPPDELSLNLLLLPYPTQVAPVQFYPIEAKQEMQNMPEEFGFFTFDQNTHPRLADRVEGCLTAARKQVGFVHGLILPEAAVTEKQYRMVRRICEKHDVFLISGVGKSASNGKPGSNSIRVDLPFHETYIQEKHHRWKLDEPQIRQYGLGAQLHPERQWWEFISMSERELIFFAMMRWLVMTVLICEDLARPDPVGDLVRSVGPNLVIALLMDGPQLKQRWGARYATALADDPGCSVLTLSSLGMTTLSRPLAGESSRSRVIALWKDANTAAPTEIELPPGHEGVVVTLSLRNFTEWSADGRRDLAGTGYPLLSGIHSIKITSNL